MEVLGKYITATKQYAWNDNRRHGNKALLRFLISLLGGDTIPIRLTFALLPGKLRYVPKR